MNPIKGASKERHLVVGAGAIGATVARLLLDQGCQVVIVTRSGTGPAEAERVAADAGDGEALARLAEGATVIYNCANPSYHRWPTDWPPIASSLLGAAERSMAVLVTLSNLYAYGPALASLGVRGYDSSHPMTETTPLAATGTKGRVRAQMFHDALEAHEAGRVRAVEIRASDYIGPGANAVMGDRVVPRLLQGKSITLLGRADRLHTWTFTRDVARLAVIAGRDPRAWGHAWHVPSNPARTQREVVDDLARLAGVAPPPTRTLPGVLLRALGLISPLMRELGETQYQFREHFVMDSSAAERAFKLRATPWEEVLLTTLRSFGCPNLPQREVQPSVPTPTLATGERSPR
jgi:nucleoside-diphosphate-sugar epimerase